MAFDDGGGFGRWGMGFWGFCGLGEELVVELLAQWRGSQPGLRLGRKRRGERM